MPDLPGTFANFRPVEVSSDDMFPGDVAPELKPHTAPSQTSKVTEVEEMLNGFQCLAMRAEERDLME